MLCVYLKFNLIWLPIVTNQTKNRFPFGQSDAKVNRTRFAFGDFPALVLVASLLSFDWLVLLTAGVMIGFFVALVWPLYRRD